MGLKSKLAKFASKSKVVEIEGEQFTVYPLTLLDQVEYGKYKDSPMASRAAALIWLSLRRDDAELSLDDVLSALDNKGIVAMVPVLEAIAEVNGAKEAKALQAQLKGKPVE